MNCIVNVDKNWGIGKNDELLFTISADLKRFRELTTGKTVVLGRKTLSTFPGGRPLKNRRNVVLSSNKDLQIEGAEVVTSVEEALSLLKDTNSEDICIIGGASIYEAFLPYCHKAQITKTLQNGDADRFFPNLDNDPNWTIHWESVVQQENGISFRYIDYVNQNPKAF